MIVFLHLILKQIFLVIFLCISLSLQRLFENPIHSHCFSLALFYKDCEDLFHLNNNDYLNSFLRECTFPPLFHCEKQITQQLSFLPFDGCVGNW